MKIEATCREIKLRSRKTLSFGKKTLIMGILNITPDSFSDGGKYRDVDKALFRAEEMVREGADLIDVGGESTRPGALPVSGEEERERLRPILERLAGECPLPISLDTYKWETAEWAAELGADIINDIWGLQRDNGQMASVAAKYGMPVVVMHNQQGTDYQGDIIGSMKGFFTKSLSIAKKAGIKDIILDPGIGFGKTAAQNFTVLRRLKELTDIDGERHPLLLGVSRKSLFGAVGLSPNERREATGAACVAGIMQGVNILRVHDVGFIGIMSRVADRILELGNGSD